MTAPVELISPDDIQPNPDNPRLIFRIDELESLEDSISQQGILVPLTIYRDKNKYTLLDGERRWRCSIKLGLHKVPAIIQDKPDRLANIMMMFAIHNARRDWDPLPTALKLEDLEKQLTSIHGAPPTEAQLAASASLSRGEVRRYRKILRLPQDLRQELLVELEKPRSEQRLTVDHVIESISGVSQLFARGVIGEKQKGNLIRKTVDKFRKGVLKSTTDPRLFARVARSYERGEIELELIKNELDIYSKNVNYSIEDVFKETSSNWDFEHGTEQLLNRVCARLDEIIKLKIIRSESLIESVDEIEKRLKIIKNLFR